MAKYYLEKGLQITRIHEFIQFHSEKCLEKLSNQISDNRRAADDDVSKTILGLTSKLIGNFLYSASLLNKKKKKNRNITYRDNATVNKVINNPRFVSLKVQWNSVNKSTSGQPVLDLIRGGFNKRRFLKMHLTIVDIPLQR